MGRGRASRRKEARPCGPQPLLGTGSTAERPPARPRPGHTSPRLHDELPPSAEAATRCAAGSLPPPRTAGKRLLASRLLPGPFLLFLLRPGTSFLLCKTHTLRGGREGGRWGRGERERERSVPTSKRLPKGNAAAVPGTSAGSAGSIGGFRGRLSVFLPLAAARSGRRAPRCDPGVPGWGGTSTVHRPHDCD